MAKKNGCQQEQKKGISENELRIRRGRYMGTMYLPCCFIGEEMRVAGGYCAGILLVRTIPTLSDGMAGEGVGIGPSTYCLPS